MFGDLLGEAARLLGGSSAEDVGNATAEHVASLDPSSLVQHVVGSLGNLSDDQRSQLATTVLGVLGRHGTDEAAVQDAGVDTDAAKGGDTGAVGDLIAHAVQNPDELKGAIVSFVQQNPQIV
jgi:hypothetical protein